MTPTYGTLEYWAHEKPNEIALVEGDRSITYREWNEASDRVASALAERGVIAGDIVVMRTHIRLEWPILGAALAKLDCALLGLNWRLTPTEVQYVLANSGATALVCDDAEPGLLDNALRDLALKLKVSIDANALGFVAFDNLVSGEIKARYSAGPPRLIVYTSGTTGLPRGVVTGRPSPYYTAEQTAEYHAEVRSARRSAVQNPVVLITMPMHHAAGPAQIWGALRGGRKTILLRRFDPERALQLIEQFGVTDWSSVPTMIKRIAALPAEVLARYNVRSLRHLGVGAAPVPYALKEWILNYFGEDCLTEGYGSTETGMVTRLPSNMQRKKPGSSGLPFKHVYIEIRGANGSILPPRTPGEIWVRTPMTFAGYLNDGELKSDTLDEKGFFRVGDVGYLDEDGYLYITDRAKDLIISGGVNIYPAEIEAVLIKHPDVFDVAVIGIPDDEFGEQVKAFVELKLGRHLTAEELLRSAAEQLASYKRPKSIEFVTELPRNAMGKVLKRELRDPYWKNRERKI